MPIGIGEVEKRTKRVGKKLHLDESRRSKNQIDVVEDKRLLNLTRFAWRGFGRVGPPQKRRLLKSRNFDPATFANRQKSDSTQKERFSGPGLQPPPSDHSRLLVEGRSAESGLLDNSYEVIEKCKTRTLTIYTFSTSGGAKRLTQSFCSSRP